MADLRSEASIHRTNEIQALTDQAADAAAITKRIGAIHPAQGYHGLTWCTECSCPAPCRTRRILDGGTA